MAQHMPAPFFKPSNHDEDDSDAVVLRKADVHDDEPFHSPETVESTQKEKSLEKKATFVIPTVPELDSASETVQQNDDDDDVEYVDDENEDAESCTSNQDEDDETDKTDHATNNDVSSRRDEIKKDSAVSPSIALPSPTLRTTLSLSSVSAASNANSSSSPKQQFNLSKLPTALSLTVAEPKRKVIQEPRPPRTSGVTNMATMSKLDKKARLKFQFPDLDVMKVMLEDETNVDANSGRSMMMPPTSSSGSRGSQRRRFSSTAAVMIATSVPLRRKSFSLTKGPAGKPPLMPQPAAPSPAKLASMSRLHARRKSTTACYSNYSARSPLSKSAASPIINLSRNNSNASAATAAAAAATALHATKSSQMVVRIRERKLDGIPELVISKRPARGLVWQWHDRQIHVPFQIQLGPHQHGIMLRQLRYVKSVMNDFPWAKAHLKDLLASYTKKDMTKEVLYPQLNLLSAQVQDEISTQTKKQRQLAVKKQKLTMQLSLATNAVNEIAVIKYGRRGKPHETKLCYDPGQPTKLFWIRKHGEQSTEALDVDLIQIQRYAEEKSNPRQRTVKKFPPSGAAECCVSLIAPGRSLDLQAKSTLHRDWLVNAMEDVISFARQYKAAGARREASNSSASPGMVNGGGMLVTRAPNYQQLRRL